MDELPKCMKITVRAELADGSVIEAEAAEPEKVMVSYARDLHDIGAREPVADSGEYKVVIRLAAGRSLSVQRWMS